MFFYIFSSRLDGDGVAKNGVQMKRFFRLELRHHTSGTHLILSKGFPFESRTLAPREEGISNFLDFAALRSGCIWHVDQEPPVPVASTVGNRNVLKSEGWRAFAARFYGIASRSCWGSRSFHDIFLGNWTLSMDLASKKGSQSTNVDWGHAQSIWRERWP